MELKQFKSKLGRRLILITLIIISGVIVTLLSFYFGLKASLIDVKKLHSKDLANTAVQVVKHYYLLARASKITEEQAKRKSLQVIQDMKFSQNGYYWVANGEGVMLMHPYTTDMIGKNLTTIKDDGGNFLYPNFVKTAKSGGGTIQYYWSKPTQHDERSMKLSYIAYFEPWNWIVGTGIYIDDMEQSIKEYAYRAIAVVVFFTLLFLITAMEFTRRLIDELRKKAIRDPLTKLYSRRYLNESLSDLHLKVQRESGMYLAVLFFDIDHFKRVNDTYGHTLGDEVISKVGSIMLEESRPDDLCVRYGGEEFLIVTISESVEAAQILANRVKDSISNHQFHSKDESFNITISIGIAYQKKRESIDKTIDRADRNLYRAKRDGRNRIVSDLDE